MSAALSILRTDRDGTLKVKDGTTPTPLEVTVPFTNADFSADGLKEFATDTTNQRAELLKFFSRGRLQGVRRGNETQPTFSWTSMFDRISSQSVAKLYDIIHRTTGSTFENAISTCGATYPVYLLDVELTFEGTNFGDTDDEVFLLKDCDLGIGISETAPNALNISGECLGQHSVTST